ncbi:hypothetical protein B0H19DRAFT_1169064, partial [Mycena capillaripes]
MYLENLRQELAELEISITRQRALLEELEERKSTIQAELDAFIFPIFLQYAFDEDHDEELFPCLAVHLLLSVCRAWRTLALSVPALWATLDLGSWKDSLIHGSAAQARFPCPSTGTGAQRSH